MLRTAYIAESCGQSTSHSRILSRYSHAIMAAPMDSEDVRFKINFMMYNILIN